MKIEPTIDQILATLAVLQKSSDDGTLGSVYPNWDVCLNCLLALGACLCPACATGDADNCWCAGNTPASGFGDVSGGDDMTKATDLDGLTHSITALTVLISKAITSIAKGWLPSGTSQNDLDDGDFLWISEAYRSGKTTDISAGRKLPFKIHGKVNVRGWMAAWAALHGSQGGADYTGGPSREQCLAKLKANKPSGITIEGDHASTSTKKAQEGVIQNSTASVRINIEKSGVSYGESSGVKYGVIFGKASIAGVVDREGDVISEEELRLAAWKFNGKSVRKATNTHGVEISGVFVESYVRDGVWHIAFKPDDIEIAKAADRGEFVGFSIAGTATKIPLDLAA